MVAMMLIMMMARMLFVVMMTIAAVCVLFVDLDFKSPNSELFKDIKALLKNVELDVFFIVVFMSGIFYLINWNRLITL